MPSCAGASVRGISDEVLQIVLGSDLVRA